MTASKCFSCGGEYPEIAGPTHRYMASSPGCWAIYGEVLAREYSDPAYFPVHRLTVDSYAVQHPGSNDRQSIHSVGIHLICLCLSIEHGLTAEHVNDAMRDAGRYKDTFTWLQPPQAMGELTAADVVKAQSADEHVALVNAWAESAWKAWSEHHDTIRSWLPVRPVC